MQIRKIEIGSALVHVALLSISGRPGSADTAGLMRALLSRVLGGAETDWSIGHDGNGAPFSLLRGVRHPAFISLSRTQGLAAACVSIRPVGIDVEKIEPHAADEALAGTFFSEEERGCLRAMSCSPPPCGEGLGVGVQSNLPTPDDTPTPSPSPHGGGGLYAETFFRIWTMKEAYIKARGLGFGIDLQSFSVVERVELATLVAVPDESRESALLSEVLKSGHALGMSVLR